MNVLEKLRGINPINSEEDEKRLIGALPALIAAIGAMQDHAEQSACQLCTERLADLNDALEMR